MNILLSSEDEATIVAQCTPIGSGAIALIRITGTASFTIASQLSKLASGSILDDVASHTIHYGYAIDSLKNNIDAVLFLAMRGPQTFTGQDTVEITCHNNQFIIEAIIQQAIQYGARLAQPGEFTKRSVLNKKIDLLQAEAINELIHANTQHALKLSLSQVTGSFSQWINTLEETLLNALALSEASFEFLDEEMNFAPIIKTNIEQVIAHVEEMKQSFNQQQQIRQGIRIAIIGSVNAGKSSLFNALLNKERAIVTNIAGTTRDALEAGLYKNGNYWTLVDTAGLRETEDIIEQEGIKKSWQEAELADIILLVFDSSRAIGKQEKVVYQGILEKYAQKIIAIKSKIDLCYDDYDNNLIPSAALELSVHNKVNIAALEFALEEKIKQLFSTLGSSFLLNTRQFNLLQTVEIQLKQIMSMLQEPVYYELVSYHLRDALEQLSQLTGKTISEQAMDAIFHKFCVGK